MWDVHWLLLGGLFWSDGDDVGEVDGLIEETCIGSV
jgi:hypothetical protein